ncbi:transporter substrate-binding domain-containing protein [Vibrio sp. 404]|uniref:histidine kinase n=1 Tax=Vibrio marinisediminis TaxID=2758441 RepID=A0A7W2FUD3_9VIBR|nr:ATP-binding protein [Vibrio marinisediminis]MBA5764359.1 transporter substrate-binding domain-containing protein [Vibrio marinisediminis]
MKAVFYFVISLYFISTQSLATTSLQKSTEIQPIRHTGELTVGRQYDVHNYLWRPAKESENNTTYQDIVEQFAESIGAKVNYRYYSHRDDLLAALYYGEVDMAIGYAETKEASQYFNFSRPIFNIRSVTWFHDSALRNKPKQSLKWGCVRGSVYCELLHNDGFTDVAMYNTHHVLMRSLASGEIDVTYTDVLSAEQYLSVRTAGEWMGDLDNFSNLPTFSASILTVKSNQVLHDQIESYLSGSEDSIQRNQRTLIDPLGEEMMLKALNLEYGHSVIRYSFEGKMRPFSYQETGSNYQVGYIHDLMSMLSRKSGIQFEYVPSVGRNPVEMLKTGEIDILPGYVADNTGEFIFTHSFGAVDWTYVESNTKTGSGKTAILDRSGRLIMPQARAKFEDMPIFFKDLDSLLLQMKEGNIDYAYIPSYVVDYYAYGNNNNIYSIILNSNAPKLGIDLGFTLNAGSTLLQSIMNDILKLVSSNEIEMLHLKHHKVIAQYGYDKSKITIVALSILSLFLLVVVAFQVKSNRLSKSLMKADEVALQNSKRLQWLSDLLDRLPSMIAIYDADGEIALSNKAFNQHGKACSSFKKGRCLLKNHAQSRAGSESVVCQCRFSKRYLRVIENEISGMNDDGRYKMMVFDDYTILEKQKDELKASNAKALEAIKAQDLFLATISHELRTPIAAMIGLMELMSSKVESEENVELLSNAQLSASRLRLLVNDILDISKIRANQFHLDIRNGNVYSELSSLLRTYESNASMKHLEFALNWKPTPYVKAKFDWLRVAQILNNLLSNALKFTQTGRIVVNVELQQHQLIVEVNDTGCGMNEEQLSHMFTPFAQGDVSITRQYGGTGLGMTIVKSIVDMMSGDLSVSSQYGVGTTMRVTLQTENTSMFSAQDLSASSSNKMILKWLETWGVDTTHEEDTIRPVAGWNNIYPDFIFNALHKASQQFNVQEILNREFIGHVLVVDDDPINRLLFGKQFSKLGIVPAMANDGAEAYEYICDHFEKIDLVITDCHMPKLDGYELTRRVKESPAFSQLPMVGCTAEDSKIVVEKAASAGMDFVLYKPYSFEELANVVAKYLELKQVDTAQVVPHSQSDFSWLEEHLPCDQYEMMSIVVESFKQEKALIESEQDLKHVVHRLKGSTALLELTTLTTLTKQWEIYSENNEQASTSEILAELTRLISLFEKWLNDHKI